MDDSDLCSPSRSSESQPSGPASAGDSSKYPLEHSIPPPPDYDSTSTSEDDDFEDDLNDPYYPNRALQLLRHATPPHSPKPSSSSPPTIPSPTAHHDTCTPSPTPRPPSRSGSPPRRPRLLSHHPSDPLPPAPLAHPSAPSPSSSPPLPPTTPLPPTHNASSFMSPPTSSSAAGPSGQPLATSKPGSPPQSPFSVEEVQKRIRAISCDPNLSEDEKNKQRQAILSQPFQQRRKKEALAFVEKVRSEQYIMTKSQVDHPETGERMPGCEHYPRYCKIKADCCGLWVCCRLCHDHPSMDHSMNRFNTKEVMCVLCFTVQPVARRCVNPACQVEFARYFCDKCKFYDNTPGKDIYHCDKCKICRVGKGIGHDNFHCDRCDACVSREYSKTHRCLKKSLDANCPICGQYLYTSTKPVVFMRCGHTMHSHCFTTYTAEHYICPLCHKALTNMRPYYAQIDEAVQREVMPPEHRNKVSEVLCHDCDQRSETPFHFLYLKCQTPDCGSYNTRLIRTYEKGSADAAQTVSSSNRNATGEVGEEDNGMDIDDDEDSDDQNDGMSDVESNQS